MTKPIEFWVALAAGVGFVALRNKKEPLITRTLVAGISGGLGFSLTPDISIYTGVPEIPIVLLLTSIGYIALEVLVAIVSDKDLMIDTIKSKLGKGSR